MNYYMPLLLRLRMRPPGTDRPTNDLIKQNRKKSPIHCRKDHINHKKWLTAKKIRIRPFLLVLTLTYTVANRCLSTVRPPDTRRCILNRVISVFNRVVPYESVSVIWPNYPFATSPMVDTWKPVVTPLCIRIGSVSHYGNCISGIIREIQSVVEPLRWSINVFTTYLNFIGQGLV